MKSMLTNYAIINCSKVFLHFLSANEKTIERDLFGSAKEGFMVESIFSTT